MTELRGRIDGVVADREATSTEMMRTPRASAALLEDLGRPEVLGKAIEQPART